MTEILESARPGLNVPLPPHGRAVLDLLADGHSDREIAGRLRITVAQVVGLIAALMTRFGAFTRPALVAAGYNALALTPEPDASARTVSDRDQTFLVMVAAGWPESRIAAAMDVKPYVVHDAVAYLRRRFRARNAAHLVRRAVDAGVLTVPIPAPGDPKSLEGKEHE